MNELRGKIVLITGSSDGIGLATAIALAEQGADLILVARNEAKLKTAVRKIQSKGAAGNVRYFVAELSSQKSIRQLAEQIKIEYQKIDVLINNAGCISDKFRLTEDGFETVIATNYFAYFLLTLLLLELLKKSDQARVINVTSALHEEGRMDFESFRRDMRPGFLAIVSDIAKARFSLKLLLIFIGYFTINSYAQSKLAVVLFTLALAEKLKDTSVTVNCLHPGFVKTDIGCKGTRWYSGIFWKIISSIGGISVQAGAETSAYLASSGEVKEITGKYFVECKIKEPSLPATNETLRHQLWEISEKCCAVNL